MLHLEKITPANVWDIINLKVAQKQKKFVTANDISIVEAYSAIGTGCETFPFGIYDDKKAVGFLMICFNEAALDDYFNDIKTPEINKNNYSILSLMIDKRYQKRGYGRAAMKLALDFIRTFPCGKAEYCSLSYVPDNDIAANMFHSFGFKENGEKIGYTIVAAKKL